MTPLDQYTEFRRPESIRPGDTILLQAEVITAGTREMDGQYLFDVRYTDTAGNSHRMTAFPSDVMGVKIPIPKVGDVYRAKLGNDITVLGVFEDGTVAITYVEASSGRRVVNGVDISSVMTWERK